MKKIIFLLIFTISINTIFSDELKVIRPIIQDSMEINYDKITKNKIKMANKIYNEKYEKNIKLSKDEENLLKWASEKELEYSVDGEGDNWYNVGGPYKIKASSELKTEGENRYSAENAHDDDLRTAWIVKNTGIGDFLEYYFEANSPRITKIIIFNGYIKTPESWINNSRVKKLKMYINNKQYAVLEIADLKKKQIFELEPLQSKVKGKDLVLKFEILEIYEGEKYKDTAITELMFDGLDVLCFPYFTNITLSNGSVKTIDRIKLGDDVLTYNTLSKKMEKTKVVSVAKVPHNNLVEIDFGDRVITSTDDHPYLSENGWKSCNVNGTKQYKGYENVKELKTGDKIYFIGENGKSELKEINGIKKVDKKEMCYTITKVENGDNFIADGAVVGVEEIKEE